MMIPTIRRLAMAGAMLTMLACAGDGQTLREDPGLRDRLQPLAERAMQRDLVPGLQVAVVMQDGRTWTGSFGTADMNTGRPVTDDTRFYIASTTKALTALTAARYAHQGKLDLDASLAEAFPPGTRFHPDYDPTTATVRDLLTHTHGLQQGPISIRTAYTGQITNEKILELLPVHPPREDRKFSYSNFGYDLTGFLLDPEHTRGWKEVEQHEVLDPLGMTHTTSHRSRLPDSLIAFPHEIGPDGMGRIRLAKGDANLGPAGGHFTTASDLARLLLVELNHGRLGGEQVIPATVIDETQRPQVPQQREFLHYKRHAWGLGWDIGTLDGDTVIHRPGGFAGYYANVAFLPNYGFGVAVLTNGGGGGARLAELVVGAILDELRGRDDPAGRLDRGLDELAGLLADRQGQAAERVAGYTLLDEPRRPLDAYTGTYADDLIGTVEIVADGPNLRFEMGMARCDLRQKDVEGDVFFAQILDQDDQVTFEFDDGSRATGLSIRGTGLTLKRR